jgi:hypothetical protein
MRNSDLERVEMMRMRFTDRHKSGRSIEFIDISA